VKERRGALGRVSELAENVAAGVKRRQQARAPRVVLYDGDGKPRTLPVAVQPALGMVEVAEWMVELSAPPAEPEAEVEEE
jgi:hypothetical protein